MDASEIFSIVFFYIFSIVGIGWVWASSDLKKAPSHLQAFFLASLIGFTTSVLALILCMSSEHYNSKFSPEDVLPWLFIAACTLSVSGVALSVHLIRCAADAAYAAEDSEDRAA